MDEVLSKPINIEVLNDILKEILEFKIKEW
jgi:hypothetical protein